jgi:DNA-binding PucR family transcriptional regulator
VLAAPAGLDVPISGLAIIDPDDAPDEHRGGLVLVVGARGRDAMPLVRAAGAAGAAAVALKVGAADGSITRAAPGDTAGSGAAGSGAAGSGAAGSGAAGSGAAASGAAASGAAASRGAGGGTARGGAAGRAAGGVAVGAQAAVGAEAVDGRDDERAALREAAVAAGVALLAVPADVRWERLESLAAGVLDASESGGPDDLFALAQTVALLTHGIVCIEDTASRVLAYSRSDSDDGQIDELRRLSILGWQGPADYLRHLREWGVFDRLRAGEEVVLVDEHAELGVRRRLAIGIHAGPRALGTIWVQEGAQPFSPRAEDVLVGAARVAAGHLVRRRRTAPTWHRDLVEGLLDGRASPDLVAGTFGLDEHAPAIVVGFAVRADPDVTGVTRELSVAELADLVAVHAAGYRRAALTAWRGDTVYALLPDTRRVDAAMRAMCAEVVAATRRRTGVRVQAGIGAVARDLAGAQASRAEADRVLVAMPADAAVAAFDDLRAEVLLDQTLAVLRERPDLRDPAVDALVAYDHAHGGDLAGSVLAWLDAHGDVRAAARLLTVHPNTLRYRVRRAVAVAGLRLGDPRARLVHHLALHAARAPDPI